MTNYALSYFYEVETSEGRKVSRAVTVAWEVVIRNNLAPSWLAGPGFD